MARYVSDKDRRNNYHHAEGKYRYILLEFYIAVERYKQIAQTVRAAQ
jgi:hypothetical protein